MSSDTQSKLPRLSSQATESEKFERLKSALRDDFKEAERFLLNSLKRSAWDHGNIGPTENIDIMGVAQYLKSERASKKVVEALLVYVLHDANDNGDKAK